VNSLVRLRAGVLEPVPTSSIELNDDRPRRSMEVDGPPMFSRTARECAS